MICFCCYAKKLFFILSMAYNDHFFVQIRPKKVIFQSFYQYFLRTTGLQHKLLKLIESSNIFHWKSAKKRKLGVVFGRKFGSN